MWASGQGGTAEIAADGNNIFGNGQDGIGAQGTGAVVTASRNLVTRNRFGLLQISNGTFFSAGNNTVNNNTDGNTTGTITPLGGL
jgi:hypothetical protein